MRKWSQFAAALAVITSILACTMPSGDAVTGAATAFAKTQTAEALVPPSPTAAPGDTAAAPSATTAAPTAALPPTACSPVVTANLNANVRAGDSTDYEIIGFLAAAQSAPLMGRNAADTWWYIAIGGGHGWIAKSVTNASCLPAVVAVVAPPPLPPTLTPEPEAEAFAVTSVNYTFSEVDLPAGDNCPKMTANITVNGPGTVVYQWKRSDGANAPIDSIVFGAAGTQAVSTTWSLGAVWEGDEHWLGIYVDDPNHQEFGHKTFTDACDG